MLFYLFARAFPGVGGRIGYGDMDRSRYANTINILDVKTLHCNQYTTFGSRIANYIPNGDVLIILIRSKLIKNEFTKSKYLHVSV